MLRRLAPPALLLATACTGGGPGASGPGFRVDIELVNPTLVDPFGGVDTLRLSVEVDGIEVASASAPVGEPPLLEGLDVYGPVRFHLAGLAGDTVLAYGRTPEVLIEPGVDRVAPLTFLPVNVALPLAAEPAAQRSFFGSALLPDGRVLAVGGRSPSRSLVYDDLEIYDPRTGSWADPGVALDSPVYDPTLAWGGDLQLFVSGGLTGGSPTDTASAWDPLSDELLALAPMTRGRGGHCLAFFRDDYALVLGGTQQTGDAETLRRPAQDAAWTWAESPIDGLDGRQVRGCVAVEDGRVFVLGADAASTGVFDFSEEAEAQGAELRTAFTPMDATDPGQAAFPDGALLVPVGGGQVWIGGGLEDGAAAPEAAARLFDLDQGRFSTAIAPEVPRVDGSWSPWIEEGWVALGCGSSTGDPEVAQPVVELLNVLTGQRYPSVQADRNRPGCQLVVQDDGALLLLGGYAPGDEGTQVDGAAIVVPYDPS